MSHLRRAASGGAQMVRPATIPEMAKAARLELVGVVGAKDPIAHLGGCLNVSRLLTLAGLQPLEIQECMVPLLKVLINFYLEQVPS